MAHDAEAVVVGASALGSSIAFTALRLGGRGIVLGDKHDLTSQTSLRAAGLTGVLRSTEFMTRLAMLAVKKIEKFKEETGEPMVYFQTGSLKIARKPAHEQQLRWDCERGHKFGLDVDLVFPAGARRLTPFLETARSDDFAD